jgi:hypothetical protein
MLIHSKFANSHALALIIVVSLNGVGGDIQQPSLSILLSLTLQHVVPYLLLPFYALPSALLQVLLLALLQIQPRDLACSHSMTLFARSLHHKSSNQTTTALEPLRLSTNEPQQPLTKPFELLLVATIEFNLS